MERHILARDWSLDHLQPISPTRYACAPADELLSHAERNDCDAMFTIGYRCETGDQDTPKNVELAVQWYERAASRASSDAAFNLGRILLRGPDEFRHPLNAAKLFHYAAERGNLSACFVMGVLFDAGLGLPAKPDEAVHWYRRAASNGYPAAAVNISRLFFSLTEVKTVHLEAVKYLRELDKKPCPSGWTNLGVAYEFGLALPVDSAKAADLFLRAAEHEIPEAYYHLGRLHRLGRGVAQDDALAAEWWNKAAELGFQPAVQMLSEMQSAEEPQLDFEADLPTIEPATPSPALTQTPPPMALVEEQPRPTATMRRIKYRGAKVSNTIAELMTIAEAGIVDAQFNLGVLFRDGAEGRYSPHDAVYWLRQAGNQGDGEALWLLGSMYADGDGIRKCEWEAEKIFRQAIEFLTAKGHDTTRVSERLERMLGPVIPVKAPPRPDPIALIEAALSALRERPKQTQVACERLREALATLEN